MKVKWEEMFPDELKTVIEKCPVCYLAFGLAEPHGPYNAIGLDWLKAYELVQRASREHGGVVAPPFAWHVAERAENPWLANQGIDQSYAGPVSAEAFMKVLLCQLRAVDARGFHAAIAITGHYGGHEADCRLLCEFYTRRTGSPLQIRFFADHEVITLDGVGGDHAGVVETSQLMALRPDLVDLNRTVETSSLGRMAGSTFPYDDGRAPSAELGQQIVASQVTRLGEIQRELLDAYQSRSNWQAPAMNDIEDIWERFHRTTRKYWWWSRTTQQHRDGQIIEFPGWEALGE